MTLPSLDEASRGDLPEAVRKSPAYLAVRLFDHAMAMRDRVGWGYHDVEDAATLLVTMADAPRDQQIIKAETIAHVAHHGQTDKQGHAYIAHVARVAGMVSADAKAAAWLHDVIEDTSVDANMLIEWGIALHTIRSVEHLTRPKAFLSYEAYIDALCASGDLVAIEVKRADLIDHFGPHCPASLRPRYEAAWPQIDAAYQSLQKPHG